MDQETVGAPHGADANQLGGNVTRIQRIYSQRTLKVLFALSGNQCAHPDCTNRLIEPATEGSDAFVAAHVCHIHALSGGGPRWKPSLSQKELNSPDNLILLCPTHHAGVDGQPEKYPAKTLREWKRKHESVVEERLSIELDSLQPEVFPHPYFPTALIDRKIEDEIQALYKSRFFGEFDGVRVSLTLARRLVEGELAGGTDAVRCRALAWCARVLSPAHELGEVHKYLALAKSIGTCTEIDIAEAFIASKKGDMSGALKILAGIDTPSSRSAALIIAAHQKGAQGAIDWLKDAAIEATDLDPDGKHCLLTCQLALARWDTASEILSALTNQDLEVAPVLHHTKAMTQLLTTVPAEFRAVILNQWPFNLDSFPLASDEAAMDARRAAQWHFAEAAMAARQLHCSRTATVDDEYALWLKLRDPKRSDDGRHRLQEKLRDVKSALRVVPFALRFGIELNLAAVEKEIDRQIALNGGITEDAAIARFALVLTRNSAEDAANYLVRHYDELTKHLDEKSIRFVQVDMFAKAGLPERANECLELLLHDGLSQPEEGRLRRIISEAEGADPVENRKEQFKQSNLLSDLASLVEALEIREDWDGLCEYGALLFERTHSVPDAERLAIALDNAHSTERSVEFMNANYGLLSQSRRLRMAYSWALYQEGALVESRNQLAKLADDSENPNYRALQVHLRIALGDWNGLSAFVEDEYQKKDRRSALELMDATRLALQLSSPYARDLIFAAVAKAGDDAAVLANAYFLASSAGWENDAQVSQWLNRAAELSGDDGPLQKMSIQDLLDRKPKWDLRESETWRLFGRGEVPMFLTAESLHRSLTALMLSPALANLQESDPRHRRKIPAYSGQRQPAQLLTVGTTAGMDATALLTVGLLDLLDQALGAFETVWVPHSTLAWLFEEKQKAAFHQPSRIRDAHQIRHFLATNVLEQFIPSTVADSDLAAQIGDELALFIAEAEKVRDDDTQRIVVRSSPVHRLSSLMDEEADLTEHAPVLSSCLSVVEVLRQKGQITLEEERRARTYLNLQEKPWPNQPTIKDGAVLYLDELAITYLLHLGILRRIKDAGFKPIASPRKIEETNELIAYESTSGEAIEVIERIRSAVSSRIESGAIRVGSRGNVDGEQRSTSQDPTVGLFALVPNCNAVITDDRFLNRHDHIDAGSTQVRVFSTLDLLDALADAGAISTDDRSEHRTRLRRAGYCFVPVTEDELTRYLTASVVSDNKVIETAELRAIRENLLQVRMSDWLQLPKEAPWLDMTLKAFVAALKNLWKADAHVPDVMIRSNWLADKIDTRGWVHCFGPEKGSAVVKAGPGAHILMLCMLPLDAPPKLREAYWRWLEGQILTPIKEHFSDLYAFLVALHRRQIAEVAAMKSTESGDDKGNTLYVKAAIVHAALEFAPPLIRQSLLDDPEFSQEFEITIEASLSFGDFSIQRAELFDAVRDTLGGAATPSVKDSDGREWTLRNEAETGKPPKLVLVSNGRRRGLAAFSVLSPDPAIRLNYFDEAASDLNLGVSSGVLWRNILAERALEGDEVDQFNDDLRNTPVYVAESIRTQIRAGESSVSSLVPSSRRYFERLVGVYDGSPSIRDYASGAGRQFLKQLASWKPYDGFLFSLLLSSHSALTATIDIDYLDRKDLVRIYDFLTKRGDMFSRLGATEVGLRILPETPEVKPFVLHLIEQIRDDDIDSSTSEFQLLSALFFLVDGELSRSRVMSAEPPFYRRLASLSHAALIHREFLTSGVERGPILKWAINNRGEQCYMQSLADMRLEPRWNPDFAAALQIKAEFFGRILNAANNLETKLCDSQLQGLIFGETASLESLSEFPFPYLPGPLEGGEGAADAPSRVLEAIEEQLDTDEAEASSFTALVNSALLFRVGSDQAELARKALKLGHYRIASVKDKPQLFTIVNGLATVAAVARSPVLADELRILMRGYRRDAQYGFTIAEELTVCLVAAASRADLAEWRDFVGDWLTELAFWRLEDEDARVLLSCLRCLCHAVPELWLSCGKADAALMAFSGR